MISLYTSDVQRGGPGGGGYFEIPPLTFEIFRTPPPSRRLEKSYPPLAEGEEKIGKILRLSVLPRKYRKFFKFSGKKYKNLVFSCIFL